MLFFAPVLAGAQQVRVLSEVVDFAGEIGSSQRKTVILQNEANQSKTYLLKNLRGSVGSSQKVKICIDDQCFDPKKDLAKISLKLAPGEIYTDLYLEFELGIAETRGSFDLFFVNAENIRENFVVEARYEVASTSTKDFSHKDINLSEIYPNPSNRVAQLDYELVNPKAKAKISINSFIGNPIAEYELDPERNSLVINVTDFQPGVYFYTLFVDNKNVVTKKLQVKK
ncbi:Por secretion system C-terminal sorting domain-containing protein [Algoriphagus boritolerans DSM 17298 = JCM 18970]|uniref:Por secretion system C-terminal sorting domain-containing protein n=2 Tax=Algoriphagus TaxID=246875 RepID=A0A1H5T3Z2_9BACT|nr:T9SS type A sorting domain-containing protein [Algoriphagus boritolerans]SEF57632.1 Por secretion system C-terminal sorting domain-containing protein [Algoriphagus boritolerans DSM 17298 = JCM 18970]